MAHVENDEMILYIYVFVDTSCGPAKSEYSKNWDRAEFVGGITIKCILE